MAMASAVMVVVLELSVLRTGLFRRSAYWIAMVIVVAFMIPVDGWLTKLSAPDRDLRPRRRQRLATDLGHPRRGVRLRLRALITLVLLCWERPARRDADRRGWR